MASFCKLLVDTNQQQHESLRHATLPYEPPGSSPFYSRISAPAKIACPPETAIWQSYCKWFIHLTDAIQANKPSPGANTVGYKVNFFFLQTTNTNLAFLLRVGWSLQNNVNRFKIKKLKCCVVFISSARASLIISLHFLLLLFLILMFLIQSTKWAVVQLFPQFVLFFLLVLMKDRCKLFCRVAGTTAYYQLKDRVIDGTPCGPDTYDICVQGLCRVRLHVSSSPLIDLLIHAKKCVHTRFTIVAIVF